MSSIPEPKWGVLKRYNDSRNWITRFIDYIKRKQHKPGLNGAKISLTFDFVGGETFEKGAMITYDFRDGVMLHVDEVKDNTVITQVVAYDIKNAWFPVSRLNKGRQFYKLRHSGGEYATMY